MHHDYDPAAKKMTVRGATEFPAEVFEHAKEIEILDMSSGNMTALPEEIASLPNLRVAFFSDNDFEEVPEALANCHNLAMVGFKSCNTSKVSETCLPPNLRDLILTDNHISELPKSIGDLKDLQKLMLAGNQLQSLPTELLNCQKLEKLRIAANQFSPLPEWLFELPNLAWYVDAGNPGSFSVYSNPDSVKTIAWNEITLGDKIGQSAMNVVYKGFYQGNEVAIKVYGNALTSDGLPQDEINACITMGMHDNLIGTIGRLDSTDGRQALVMPLVPAHFTTTGQPPNFMTHTRDTYPPDATFSTSFITQSLTDVSSALQHMHSRGVMHGDVYAHNILADMSGHSYLGDFGAASIYDRHDTRRERIDVRAFGYLMDELLSRHTPAEPSDNGPAKLHDLKAACLHSIPSERPTFGDIQNALNP